MFGIFFKNQNENSIEPLHKSVIGLKWKTTDADKTVRILNIQAVSCIFVNVVNPSKCEIFYGFKATGYRSYYKVKRLKKFEKRFVP